MLIHREYASGVPARFIIEYGKVTTENANRPHGFGLLDPETSTPYQKNPVIGSFFREIDRADELGSGMRNMMQYGKKYGGEDPQLIEGDIFRMIISIPEFGGNPAAPLKKVIRDSESQPESLKEKIIHALKNKELSKSELSIELGQKEISGQLNKAIRELIKQAKIEYTIPDKPNSRLQKYRLKKGRKM